MSRFCPSFATYTRARTRSRNKDGFTFLPFTFLVISSLSGAVPSAAAFLGSQTWKVEYIQRILASGFESIRSEIKGVAHCVVKESMLHAPLFLSPRFFSRLDPDYFHGNDFGNHDAQYWAWKKDPGRRDSKPFVCRQGLYFIALRRT